MADRVASTELLVLDIDGIQMPGSLTDVRTVAEKIIAQLPECFQDVSYIAQASASLGFKKDKVSMHFFFLLDQPTQPKICLLYTSPSPRDGLLSRMPSSA